MERIIDITIGLSTGMIAGIISGLITYFITKKHEKKKEIYDYWQNYLFSALEKCEMHIPSDSLFSTRNIIGREGSDWDNAILTIEHLLHPYNSEEKIMSEDDQSLFNNVVIALQCLSEWKKSRK